MRLLICAVGLLISYSLSASELIVNKVETVYREDFNLFEGTESSLPVGLTVWRNTRSMIDSNYYKGISVGRKTAGGCYGWEIEDNNTALGYQPTGTEFTPGYFQLVLYNASEFAVSDVSISYKIVCMNDADRSQGIEFEASMDGSSYVRIDSLRFESPLMRDDAPLWSLVTRTARLSLSSQVERSACLWFRWRADDVAGSGTRDEIGIDDLSVIFHQPDFNATLVSVW